MSHPDYKADVISAFRTANPDAMRKTFITALNELARKMYTELDDDVRAELKAEHDALHENALEEYKDGFQDGELILTDKLQEEAREKLGVALVPLIDQIEALTGMQIAVYCFKSLLSGLRDGQPDYKDIRKSFPDLHRQNMRNWGKHVMNIHEQELAAKDMGNEDEDEPRNDDESRNDDEPRNEDEPQNDDKSQNDDDDSVPAPRSNPSRSAPSRAAPSRSAPSRSNPSRSNPSPPAASGRSKKNRSKEGPRLTQSAGEQNETNQSEAGSRQPSVSGPSRAVDDPDGNDDNGPGFLSSDLKRNQILAAVAAVKEKINANQLEINPTFVPASELPDRNPVLLSKEGEDEVANALGGLGSNGEFASLFRHVRYPRHEP
uniref:Uncharacterized protein n=1 Tax=Mycena chlorophos TaxID=658473 RepID=A0ABQ0L6V4_MYCCL|nr:predicted protein [Mycena chlorophos]